jgi:hypothetical protein
MAIGLTLEPNKTTGRECGRAASVANAVALRRAHRSVLASIRTDQPGGVGPVARKELGILADACAGTH